MSKAPSARVRVLVDRPPSAGGRHVLYWMTACRRTRFSFALEHALAWARELAKPLLVLEALRSDYRWACRRFHRFVLDGMADTSERLARAGIGSYAYVEPGPGAGRGLLEALAADACLVVADDYPEFFLPHMLAAAARRLQTRLEAIDGNGLVPLRAPGREFATAHSFRTWLHRELPVLLADQPAADPLARVRIAPSVPPQHVRRRWPALDPGTLRGDALLAGLPVDPGVGPSALRGGEVAGRAVLARFLERNLDRYSQERNDLDDEATSGLSPYLHFGHVSAHEVFARVVERERWDPTRIRAARRGARTGFWDMGESAEAFLDQLITWRELSFNTSWQRPDHTEYSSLPPWALRTLETHASDAREHRYSLDEFAASATHDPLWNAAATQLREDGRIHNYLRMLWGKKILEWSACPREALEIMIELNNRYALDGRDPNSYGGICWTLGRYDRPWGPEREIFGTVRFMSSDNTARKLRVRGYLERYGPGRNRPLTPPSVAASRARAARSAARARGRG